MSATIQEENLITGLLVRFVNHDQGEDADVWALENNYVSVVPVQFDLTAYSALDKLSNWKFS